MMLNTDYDIFQDKESVTEYKVYTRWVPHLVNVGYKDSTPCKCGGWDPHPVKWFRSRASHPSLVITPMHKLCILRATFLLLDWWAYGETVSVSDCPGPGKYNFGTLGYWFYLDLPGGSNPRTLIG